MTTKKVSKKVAPKKDAPKTTPGIAPKDEIPTPTKEQVANIMGKVHQMYSAYDEAADQQKQILKEMRNLNLQLLTVINKHN